MAIGELAQELDGAVAANLTNSNDIDRPESIR